MQFSRFPSLENHYREKFVDMVRMHAPSDDFIATEKIHGANFSFRTNGIDVRAAKRSAFIKEDETFYGCGEVVARYKDKVIELFHSMRSVGYDIVELAVYGELYGQGIQKEIDYGEKDFVAFDVCVAYDDERTERLSPVAANTMLIGHLPFVPVIQRGTLNDCLQINVNQMRSVQAQVKGVPDQICEGVVIRHATDDVILPTGSAGIIKLKSDSFLETKARKPKSPPAPLQPETQRYYELLSSAITKARLMNVVSKEGLVDKKHFGRIMSMMMGDIVLDTLKDNIVELDKKERSRAQKMCNALVSKLIKENWDDVFLP